MNHLFKAAVETPKGRFAYLGPLYRQVKQAAWDALRDACSVPGVTFNESELKVEFPNEARIQLFGADNYGALRGMHLNGVVLDEYALMHPAVWDEVIRPALAIKHGFAIFIGTPLGRNHFHRMYEQTAVQSGWFRALYRHGDSDALTGDEVELARRTMSPDAFAQEYECSFEAAIHGAYYARQLEQTRAEHKIREVSWQPHIPVQTFWDLGSTDATAIIFAQQIRGEVHLIDYHESSHEDVAHYARVLKSKPYVYARHYLPHDAKAETLAAQRSVQRQLSDLGIRPTLIVPQLAVLDGIQAARALFPRCWFDAVKCEPLLEALATYRERINEKLQAATGEPVHDWASHGADAFRYMAVGLREVPPDEVKIPRVERHWDLFHGHRPANLQPIRRWGRY